MNVRGSVDRDLGSMGEMPNRLAKAPLGLASAAESNEAPDGKTIYYWVGGIYRGAPLILGWESTYERAEELGQREMRLKGVPFKVFPLRFRGTENASNVIRRQLLEQSDLDTVLSRVRRRPIDDN